jgi:type IV secretion system protein VirB5
MLRKVLLALPLIAILTFGAVRPAAAQWAVIDVASLAQLIQQYETMQQQLSTVQSHLAQARQQYAALTGGRGMESLLSGTQRNYLPSDWATLTAAMQGASGAYGGFGASAQGILTANAVLAGPTLARLSASERAHLDGARRSPALLQAVTHQALATTSNRFASLQQLINAIPSASDPKAVFDLQARVAAEQGMLTNEGSKLQVLYQATQAEAWAQHQRRDEQAIADIGSLRALPPMGLH